MAPGLYWVDFNQKHRRQMINIIGLFQDKGTVDELGIGTTPYKMFTNYDDQDDHYQDLKQTLNFLFNSSRNSELLDVELKKYVSALQDLGHPESLDQLVQSTQSIEAMLRKVMVRTEKLSNSANRNGMLEKSTCDLGTLTRMELESFKALDNVSDVLETGDAMEYWKSGPYLLNLMDDSYAMKRKINKLADNGGLDERTALALKQATPYMLSHRDLRSYRQVDPANSKLRTLIENSIERGGWKLLWMPPSLPYYQVTEGPYAEPDLQGISKSLLFSSWQLVPKVIATMVSYEAERCMMLSGDPNANDSSHEKAKGLLRFNVSEGRNTGMNIFTLVYPCRTLASEIDPLEIAAELAREKGGQQPSYPELFMAVSRRVERLVSPLLAGRETGGREDESWYWAALALLDSRHFRKEVGEWFLPGMTVGARVKVGDKNGSSTGVIHDITGGMATVKFPDGHRESFPLIELFVVQQNDQEQIRDFWEVGAFFLEESDAATKYADHMREFYKTFYNLGTVLGRPPADLVSVLTKVAIASPAISMLRSLSRCLLGTKFPDQPIPDAISSFGVSIGMAFRSLFNLPESQYLIQGLCKGDTRYWEAALDYCAQGNIQAMMDEYLHLLVEDLADDITLWDAMVELADQLSFTTSVRASALKFDELKMTEGRLDIQVLRLLVHLFFIFGCRPNRFQVHGGPSPRHPGKKTNHGTCACRLRGASLAVTIKIGFMKLKSSSTASSMRESIIGPFPGWRGRSPGSNGMDIYFSAAPRAGKKEPNHE